MSEITTAYENGRASRDAEVAALRTENDELRGRVKVLREIMNVISRCGEVGTCRKCVQAAQDALATTAETQREVDK